MTMTAPGHRLLQTDTLLLSLNELKLPEWQWEILNILEVSNTLQLLLKLPLSAK